MSELLAHALVQTLQFFQSTKPQALPVAEVKERFKQSMSAYQALQPRLITHRKPAQEQPQYEVFFSSAEGTLGLRWEPDMALPWTVAYADHWASNLVLTVDGIEITIQSALIYLSNVVSNHPDLMTELVNRAIWSRVLEKQIITIEEPTLEAAVLAFRKQRGLFLADATEQWLKVNGLTYAALKDLISHQLKIEKYQETMVAEKVDPYFEKNHRDFDSLTCWQINGLTLPQAEDVVRSFKQDDTSFLALVPQNAHVIRTTKARKSWHSAFGSGILGDTIGPIPSGKTYTVGYVISTQSAELNTQTRAKIQEILVQNWLAEQREIANIRWHWV